MLSHIDQVAKIQQMYREGTGPVPYATFMSVLNHLLADPNTLEPKPPDDDLRPCFRAVCMAAATGILDPEGRGEQRIQEFMDNVYPAWREELDEDEFREFEKIIGERTEQAAGGMEVEAEGTTEESTALLRRLGLTEEEEPEVPQPEVFDSVDELVEELRGQELPLERTSWAEKEELAHYRIGRYQVTVALVEEEDLRLRLAVGFGYSHLDSPVERVAEIAHRMRYHRIDDFEWRRAQNDTTYILEVQPANTSVICSLPADSSDERVLLELQRTHRDLGELAESLKP